MGSEVSGLEKRWLDRERGAQITPQFRCKIEWRESMFGHNARF